MQHLVMDIKINPWKIWSWDQIQNDFVIIPFPMSPRSPRFHIVWSSYDQNTDDVFAESESDVVAELEMYYSMEKTMVSTYLV